VKFCLTYAKVIELCQIMPIYKKYAKVTPNFSSFVEVFVKLSSSFSLCQTYQKFVKVMPKLSNYVELCQFTKFCTSYAINYEVYQNSAKVIQLYRIIPKL
jgi:hypothetical protein